MSRQNRIAFLAVAALIAVVAVVILQPGDGGREARPAAAQTPTATPEAMDSDPVASATRSPKPKPKRPTVPTLRPGRERTITVNKGDAVRFAAVSETADEVHVHGYDVFREVPAGKPIRVSFKADIEGVFEIELERSGEQLARLKVEP